MAKLERTVTIQAPVEKVYEYMSQPTNLPEIWPNMIEVKDVKDASMVGGGFNWVFKMAGRRFEGSSEYTKVIPCEHVVTKSTGGISSTFDWTYKHTEEGTQVKVQVEYSVPVPLLGKLAEAFIVKQNEQEMDTLLANLKARMEEA
jgi:uncharacterized membrane protein